MNRKAIALDGALFLLQILMFTISVLLLLGSLIFIYLQSSLRGGFIILAWVSIAVYLGVSVLRISDLNKLRNPSTYLHWAFLLLLLGQYLLTFSITREAFLGINTVHPAFLIFGLIAGGLVTSVFQFGLIHYRALFIGASNEQARAVSDEIKVLEDIRGRIQKMLMDFDSAQNDADSLFATLLTLSPSKIEQLVILDRYLQSAIKERQSIKPPTIEVLSGAISLCVLIYVVITGLLELATKIIGLDPLFR